VTKIETFDNEKAAGVHVWTDDGELVEGDFVVGADGVHSQTRSEMWRMACLSGHDEIVKQDQDSKCGIRLFAAYFEYS
jgi:2-polyprenyl-6-methoxyphenol hydroxylase-like FAD-dependent oxidoreductase